MAIVGKVNSDLGLEILGSMVSFATPSAVSGHEGLPYSYIIYGTNGCKLLLILVYVYIGRFSGVKVFICLGYVFRISNDPVSLIMFGQTHAAVGANGLVWNVFCVKICDAFQIKQMLPFCQ